MSKKFDLIMGELFQLEEILTEINEKLGKEKHERKHVK